MQRTYIVKNIEWDTNLSNDTLPEELSITIDSSEENKEELFALIIDRISDEYEYTVLGCSIKLKDLIFLYKKYI